MQWRIWKNSTLKKASLLCKTRTLLLLCVKPENKKTQTADHVDKQSWLLNNYEYKQTALNECSSVTKGTRHKTQTKVVDHYEVDHHD